MLTKYRTEGEDAAKFQQLKYLVAVAEYGSITEAARRLFVSQPRITASIRDLEREMGVPCSSAQARASLTPTKVRRFSATPTKFSSKPSYSKNATRTTPSPRLVSPCRTSTILRMWNAWVRLCRSMKPACNSVVPWSARMKSTLHKVPQKPHSRNFILSKFYRTSFFQRCFAIRPDRSSAQDRRKVRTPQARGQRLRSMRIQGRTPPTQAQATRRPSRRYRMHVHIQNSTQPCNRRPQARRSSHE